jgi:DNA-cytosine methyltransferase
MVSVLSLFSGCGGFDLGAVAAGCTVAGAYEIDASACEAYEDIVGSHIHQADLQKIDFKTLPDADGLIAGPPCQDWSLAGQYAGAGGARNLFPETIAVIRTKRPNWFIIENVPGLVYWGNGEYFKKIVSELQSLGYSVSARIVEAADYGVPQTRRRIFIVGSFFPNFVWPDATHSANGDLNLSLFGDTKKRWVGWETGASFITDERRPPNWLFSRWNPENGNAFFPRKLTKKGSEFKLRWRKPDEPAFTVIASYTTGRTAMIFWNGKFYASSEGFSSWLQTIPHSPKLKMRHIGNAVPPLLASQLVAAVIRHVARPSEAPAFRRGECHSSTQKLDDAFQRRW